MKHKATRLISTLLTTSLLLTSMAAAETPNPQQEKEPAAHMTERDGVRLHLGLRSRMQEYDLDGNSLLSRAEFDAWHSANFALMDADGDSLTLEDFQGAQLGPGPYGAGHHARRAKMREQADLRKKARFQLMDSDGDGVVTLSEHDAFTEHVFLEADADDDGYLTFQELKQHNRGM